MTKDEEKIWRMRWSARTDKMWLARNILGYDRLVDHVHGPMTAKLQQFPVPFPKIALAHDVCANGKWKYRPWNDPYDLTGSRRALILFSRGYFKTTLNTITDIIQWLLNYPHLAYALIFASDQKGQDTLKNEIKAHFQYNQKLRELFPDYCPQKRVGDWGTAESFILPNRDAILQELKRPPRKEPSLSTISLDKSGTGMHYDVIKCSDIVEATNVLTPQQREQVKYRFGLLPNLLVKTPGKGSGWIHVEGTFYHADDLYSAMVKDWRKKTPEDRDWDIFIGGCFQRDTGKEAPRYDPLEMLLPFRLDKDKRRIPTWPEMDTIDKLEKEEKDAITGGYVFSCQRIVDIDAVNEEALRPLAIPIGWKKRADFRMVPVDYRVVVADLADTVGSKSNPSAIVTMAVDRAGRAYVEDIRHGKFTPIQIIDHLFEVNKMYRPIKLLIEDYAFTHGLRPSIERRETEVGIWPPWEFRPANRTTDKATRIINSLQPALKNDDLQFVDPIASSDGEGHVTLDRQPFFEELIRDELRGVTPFSTGSSDDVIDAISNFYIHREWLGKSFQRGGILAIKEDEERIQREYYDNALKKMLYDEVSPMQETMFNTGW